MSNKDLFYHQEADKAYQDGDEDQLLEVTRHHDDHLKRQQLKRLGLNPWDELPQNQTVNNSEQGCLNGILKFLQR